MEEALKYAVQIVVYPMTPSSDPFFFLYITTTFPTILIHLFLYLLTIQLCIFIQVPKPPALNLVRRSLNFSKVVWFQLYLVIVVNTFRRFSRTCISKKLIATSL